jgi:hypothetical protein
MEGKNALVKSESYFMDYTIRKSLFGWTTPTSIGVFPVHTHAVDFDYI